MKLQTQIPLVPKPHENQIDYSANLFLLGSCFSENIGQQFEHYQFQNKVNPFGILFHPKAIETFIKRVTQQQLFQEDELIYNNEQYHCFHAHSSLSNANKSKLLNNLNLTLQHTYKTLHKTTHVIITLGTAWVYKHKEQNQTVANCHKIPQQAFKKSILSASEITDSLKRINKLLQQMNPDIQIIYTVSPVRHSKDGFVENQQSKAHLISAIHQVLQLEKICYFPAYEIMMDELRDYRFYTEDMLHPNPTAVQYIWERFQHVWLHPKTKETMKQVAAVQNGLAHRPFNPNTEQHQQFLKTLTLKKEKLTKAFPFMNLSQGDSQ